MSRQYSMPLRCPYCGEDTHGMRVYNNDLELERIEFRCSSINCKAVTVFENNFCKALPDEAVYYFKSRAGMPPVIAGLIGAGIALVAAFSLLAFCVTERAENVSHETILTQTAEQAAAVDDGRLAGDDTEAAGYAARLYTDADAQALAQMAWGECRGVADLDAGGNIISPACQQAAAMWVALNRFDAGYKGEWIADIVAAPSQFHGYAADNPVDDELLALAYDVLERWQAEKTGAADVGRVIPADYLFFTGVGEYNHFTKEYGTGIYYTWELPDVYAEG